MNEFQTVRTEEHKQEKEEHLDSPDSAVTPQHQIPNYNTAELLEKEEEPEDMTEKLLQFQLENKQILKELYTFTTSEYPNKVLFTVGQVVVNAAVSMFYCSVCLILFFT